MTFGDAIDAMEAGRQVKRPCWIGRIRCLVKRPSSDGYAFDVGDGVLVDSNSSPPVTLRLEDLAADDWEVVR